MEIIEEKPITMAEVKAKLSKKKEEDNFRVNKTKEYLDRFVKISEKQAQELINKIKALNIPRLKDEMITKVVDLLPEDEDDLKLIFQAYAVTISPQNIKKIVEVVKEFKEKI